MRRKNGFTLIELLAVIVVLAIIALIATPVVVNTIEKSKQNTAIESANNIIRSAELYFVSARPRYGKIDVLDEKLNYNGKKPELGEIEIDNKGNSRIYAYINGYCVTKEYEEETYASKTKKEECDWYATDNYETREGTTFTLNNQSIKDYKIYGNSVQEVRSGKNLLNASLWSTPTTSNDLTIKYLEEEDCFLINGTAPATVSYASKYINIPNTPGTAYSISAKYVSGTVDRTNAEGGQYAVAYFGKNDNLDTNTNWASVSLKTEDNVTNNRINDKNYISAMWFYISKGVVFDNYKVKIQLEEGTEATEYEEYGEMPSPEYPSEIESTGDLITSDNCSTYGSDACDNIGKYVIQVKASGKNLLTSRITDLDNWDSYDSRRRFPIDLKVGEYYFDINYIDETGDYGYVYLEKRLKGETNWTTYVRPVIDYYFQKTTFFQIEEGYEYRFFWYGSSEKFNNLKEWQIRNKNENIDYEPYQEKITNIYLDEPLRKVGDIADYIDFNNKQVVRNIKSTIFTSHDSKDTTYGKRFNLWTNVKIGYGFAISNKFKSYYNWSYDEYSTIPYTYQIQTNPTESLISIVTTDESLTSKSYDEFNSWCKENNVIINYVLKESQIESIDLPDIEVLEGYNNMTVNTNVQPSSIKLTTTK